MLNIEQFHFINDLNGWDYDDEVLRVLGAEIRSFLDGTSGIGSRFDAVQGFYFSHPLPAAEFEAAILRGGPDE